MTVHIRPAVQTDLEDILALYPLAFPDEDLTPLLRDLLPLEGQVLSLTAESKGQIIGHGLFTLSLDHKAALLGPLAVHPDHQAKGMGGALVRSGFDRLAAQNVASVFVLGDPGYYSRFGFAQETEINPPYPMPAEWAAAWQSHVLITDAPAPESPLALPDPWMTPALWAP